MIDINKNSYCLSIDINKYNSLCDNFQKCCLTSPFRMNGLKINDIFSEAEKNIGTMRHHYTCTLNHLSVLYKAKMLKLPYYVMYEEDAFCLYTNVVSVVTDSINSLENKEWDVLFMGYSGLYPQITHDEAAVKLDLDTVRTKFREVVYDETDMCFAMRSNNVSGSHAMIIKCSAYDKIYKILQCNGFIPADKLFAERTLKTYYIKKPLFLQYDNEKCRAPRCRNEDIWYGGFHFKKINHNVCPGLYSNGTEQSLI